MRIVHVAAGAAGSYCGACTHDTTLSRGLATRGHDVEFIALYTPVHVDRDDFQSCPIFYGAINAYLQQHSAFFQHTPEFVDRLLDNGWLLGQLGRFAADTHPEDLGEMTVSVLMGPEGRQRKELERLVEYLEALPRPDVISLTNSLLSGLAPTLHERLKVPVVCRLQGEEAFVSRLGTPYDAQAGDLIRRNARSIAGFVSPSQAYADEMAAFLDVPRDRIHVIHPGVDCSVYGETSPPVQGPFRIGYLGRLSPVKGIDLLCEAFATLEEERPGGATLEVAGQALGDAAVFWKKLETQLAVKGLAQRVSRLDAPDFQAKLDFQRRTSVFAFPSRFPERLAMSCLEAMASGRPVVVPAHGVFTEIVGKTGGGILVRPDDVGALTDALRSLRDDPARAKALGLAARAGVLADYSAENMVQRTLELFESLIG